MVYFKSNIDYCSKMIIFNFLNCPKMQNDFPGEYILHILLKKFPAKNKRHRRFSEKFPGNSGKMLKMPWKFCLHQRFSEKFP